MTAVEMHLPDASGAYLEAGQLVTIPMRIYTLEPYVESMTTTSLACLCPPTPPPPTPLSLSLALCAFVCAFVCVDICLCVEWREREREGGRERESA